MAIISNVDKNELLVIAEKIRLLINSINFVIKEEIIKLSVSIGVTLIKNDDEIESLIQRADKLMYKCKNSGRNCVSID